MLIQKNPDLLGNVTVFSPHGSGGGKEKKAVSPF